MEDRVEILHSTAQDDKKPILYIMHRDMRVLHNHSLNLACDLAKDTNVVVGFYKEKLKMNKIQEQFILHSLNELNQDLKDLNIPYIIIKNLEETVLDLNIGTIVVEFCPLREYLSFHDEILDLCLKNDISFYRCDSHNIVPCKVLDQYVRTPAAVKMRINKQWDKYVKPLKDLKSFPGRNDVLNFNPKGRVRNDNVLGVQFRPYLELKDFMIPPKKYPCRFKSGSKAAHEVLKTFLKTKLPLYKEKRNSPDVDYISDLSPYLHFGLISAQFIVLESLKFRASDPQNVDCFISEIFHWREIAEHFCYHEKNYDNLSGALEWARISLNIHQDDKRETIYTLKELENAKTKDKQWNAAQKQLRIENKIHGYVRMYWAKTLLYWTEKPEIALEYAIMLNDKYSIDGNDPNGYLGTMWSICGVMDQGWAEKPIFGKIRTMKSIRAPKYTQFWNKKSI